MNVGLFLTLIRKKTQPPPPNKTQKKETESPLTAGTVRPVSLRAQGDVWQEINWLSRLMQGTAVWTRDPIHGWLGGDHTAETQRVCTGRGMCTHSRVSSLSSSVCKPERVRTLRAVTVALRARRNNLLGLSNSGGGHFRALPSLCGPNPEEPVFRVTPCRPRPVQGRAGPVYPGWPSCPWSRGEMGLVPARPQRLVSLSSYTESTDWKPAGLMWTADRFYLTRTFSVIAIVARIKTKKPGRS